MKIKEHIYFVLSFSFVVCLIFYDILILKTTFIKGDYLQQFFPWYSIYAESIKNFNLPVWIRYIECGFPLLAEGQIGVFYPLNLLFFLCLPFKFAYNYSFIFHFILAGVFTYFFARKLKIDFSASLLSAILICFGSVYGGAFVNASALKSLAWFPLVLFLLEDYLEKKDKKTMLFIGLIFGMQILTGSFQMTFYSMFFALLYFFVRNYLEKNSLKFFIQKTLFIIIVALTISLPQLIATFQLSQFSNRVDRSLGFALWNSLSPMALIGTIMPYIGSMFSRGNIIYIGIIGLFFAAVAICIPNKEKQIKALFLLFAVSLFFALGKYNPLYVVLLKIFRFYVFRAPSRFIYFAVFALAVLSGKGFSYFFDNRSKIPAALYKIFLCMLSVSIGVFFMIKLVFRYFGLKILAVAKDYVAGNIYKKPFHRYSLEVYMAKTENFYNAIIEKLSLKNPYTILTILIIIFAILLIYAIKRFSKKDRLIKYACIAFVCIELFLFSLFEKGIRPNLAHFVYANPKEEKMLNILQKDKTFFRICPFGNWNEMPLWVKPSTNSLYNLDSVAAYSPLANRDFFLLTKDLGIVDDSLGIVTPTAETLYKNLSILKNINVKYIISTVKLEFNLLDCVTKENNIYLYRLKNYLPRFIFSQTLALNDIHGDGIKIIDYRSGYAKLILENQTEGFLIFSEKFYPGWIAYIDNKKTKIFKTADIMQAIKALPGRHIVIFRYQPAYLKFVPISSAVFLLILLYGLLRITKCPKHTHT